MNDEDQRPPYAPTEDRAKYPPDQLVPLGGGRYTRVFKGPPGTDVGDLHCDLEPVVDRRRDGSEHTLVVNHSGWQPDPIQLEALAAGGHIRLSVWQHPIPPLAVSVEPPVCECHGEAMRLAAGPRFVCVHEQAAPDAVPEWMEEDAHRQAKQDFTPGEPQGE